MLIEICNSSMGQWKDTSPVTAMYVNLGTLLYFCSSASLFARQRLKIGHNSQVCCEDWNEIIKVKCLAIFLANSVIVIHSSVHSFIQEIFTEGLLGIRLCAVCVAIQCYLQKSDFVCERQSFHLTDSVPSTFLSLISKVFVSLVSLAKVPEVGWYGGGESWQATTAFSSLTCFRQESLLFRIIMRYQFQFTTV